MNIIETAEKVMAIQRKSADEKGVRLYSTF